MINLFQLGDFTLASGAKSFFKIECDAWTDDDVRCLAAMIERMVGPYSSVEGVPYGGLRLAAELGKAKYRPGWPHLIVDDVLTTGASMEGLKEERWTSGYGGPTRYPAGIAGAVVFARGPCPAWVEPLFQLPECLWVKR